ncbi:MAG: GGDEF domain-containing protein, partial [Acidobacteriota bacterium]|nr:GGDEF domain-containing protein [Acidobacteriota bacterium]
MIEISDSKPACPKAISPGRRPSETLSPVPDIVPYSAAGCSPADARPSPSAGPGQWSAVRADLFACIDRIFFWILAGEYTILLGLGFLGAARPLVDAHALPAACTVIAPFLALAMFLGGGSRGSRSARYAIAVLQVGVSALIALLAGCPVPIALAISLALLGAYQEQRILFAGCLTAFGCVFLPLLWWEPARIGQAHLAVQLAGLALEGIAIAALIGPGRRALRSAASRADALDWDANHDVLTDLPNRRMLDSYFDRLYRDGAKEAALLFIDLDHFKQVNDTLGHTLGDRLLQAAAGRLRSVLRPGEFLSRIGGDEFVVLLAPAGAEEAS